MHVLVSALLALFVCIPDPMLGIDADAKETCLLQASCSNDGPAVRNDTLLCCSLGSREFSRSGQLLV